MPIRGDLVMGTNKLISWLLDAFGSEAVSASTGLEAMNMIYNDECDIELIETQMPARQSNLSLLGPIIR